MSKYSIDSTTLSSIGDAIRSKEGSSGSILVANFADRIMNLPSGGKQYKVLSNLSINRHMGAGFSASQISIDCESSIVQNYCPGFMYLRDLLLNSFPDDKLQGFHIVIPFMPFRDEDLSQPLDTYMPAAIDETLNHTLDLSYLVDEDGIYTKQIDTYGTTVQIQINFPNVHYVHNAVLGGTGSTLSEQRFFDVQAGKTNGLTLYYRNNYPNRFYFTGLSTLVDNSNNISINKGKKDPNNTSYQSMYGVFCRGYWDSEGYLPSNIHSEIITVAEEE